MSVVVSQIMVGDTPEAWAAAGFTVDDGGLCRIGDVEIRLVGHDQGRGVVGWVLDGIPGDLNDLDGISTATAAELGTSAVAVHPNGVDGIDHVVIMTPDVDRTVSAFVALGVEPRRVRDVDGDKPMRQVFLRLGGVIVEIVGSPTEANEGPARIWGITYVVADIDATSAYFGAHTTPVKDAVQPGRKITTLRHRDLGMSVPTAFMSKR